MIDNGNTHKHLQGWEPSVVTDCSISAVCVQECVSATHLPVRHKPLCCECVWFLRLCEACGWECTLSANRNVSQQKTSALSWWEYAELYLTHTIKLTTVSNIWKKYTMKKEGNINPWAALKQMQCVPIFNLFQCLPLLLPKSFRCIHGFKNISLLGPLHQNTAPSSIVDNACSLFYPWPPHLFFSF